MESKTGGQKAFLFETLRTSECPSYTIKINVKQIIDGQNLPYEKKRIWCAPHNQLFSACNLYGDDFWWTRIKYFFSNKELCPQRSQTKNNVRSAWVQNTLPSICIPVTWYIVLKPCLRVHIFWFLYTCLFPLIFRFSFLQLWMSLKNILWKDKCIKFQWYTIYIR